MTRLSHTRPATPVPTVGSTIARIARALRKTRVHFGHGTDNARDEAAELVFYVAKLPHSLGAEAYDRPLKAAQILRIDALLKKRSQRRVPLAYLTHRAFFAGLELYVDERVLVPRSPIAELALRQFAPWIDARRVRRILDVGTGSGAIALACARNFPKARVDAADVSKEALTVCRRNIRRLRLASRVRALHSNYLQAVRGRYDMIISNPPYVPAADMRRLPREYRHEPSLGLKAGEDGLDAVRALLEGARRHLREDGILVVEVGNTEKQLLRAYPRMPFIWPQIDMGGGGVFILRAVDLQR